MEAWDSDFILNLRQLRGHVELNGFPGAIIAGGCLRDMLLDKPISDIDIFYPAYKANEFKVPLTLKSETPKLSGFSEAMVPIYDNSFTQLTHVAVHKQTHLPIQFIKVDLEKAGYANMVEYVFGVFPLTISRVCMDYDGLHVSTSFLTDSYNKYLVFDDTTPPEYEDKITAKYSDWKNLNF